MVMKVLRFAQLPSYQLYRIVLAFDQVIVDRIRRRGTIAVRALGAHSVPTSNLAGRMRLSQSTDVFKEVVLYNYMVGVSG